MSKKHDPLCVKADLSVLVKESDDDPSNVYKVESLCVCDIIEQARNSARRLPHDPLCVCYETGTCCYWIANCDCQCLCDFIREVRAHEQARIADKGKACEHCGEYCSEPLDMDEHTKAVYNAIFGKTDQPLSWSESEDCGMNKLMFDIANAAAKASREFENGK